MILEKKEGIMLALSHEARFNGVNRISERLPQENFKEKIKNPKEILHLEALILFSHNKKEEALQLLSKESLDYTPAWLQERPDNIQDFFDKIAIAHLSSKPQKLAFLGLLDSLGIKEYNQFLDEISRAGIEKDIATKRHLLEILKSYETHTLSESELISYKIFLSFLENETVSEKFCFHSFRINQLDGTLQKLMEAFTEFHRLEALEDFENYLTKLKAIPTQIEDAMDLMSYQKTLRIVPPTMVLIKSANIALLMAAPLEENLFYKEFVEALNKGKFQNSSTLIAKLEAILREKVIPIFEELKSYCLELVKDSDWNSGSSSLPNGKEYYASRLRVHTTTSLSAEEIHALGVAEVAKIHRELRDLLSKEGFSDENKSVLELLHLFGKQEHFYFSNDFLGREKCLQKFQAILDRSRDFFEGYFDKKPSYPLEIRPVPKEKEEGAPGAYYYQPSLDGTRPACFFVNLRNMKEVPTYLMPTLAIHEGEPGHHFQLALQSEMNLPLFRKIGDYTGYVEGWALYTEKLAYEEGFFETNADKIGHFTDELLRAARLVVDTGIHHFEWTRDEAIEYLAFATGYEISASETEVDRYFVLPGQACAYKIGQLKILELREKAKKELGNLFEIREFHNAVLELGAAPLNILEDVIHDYIYKKKKREFSFI